MNKNFIKIEAAGCRYDMSIRYRSVSKALVVFIHGLGCSQNSFEDVWRHKDFKGTSLLTFDLLGFGRSEKPADFSYSMEDHAAVCESVVRSFPHKRFHVVAHSMGAAIGLLFSDNMFDSVISFVNVEGNLISEDCGLVSRQTTAVSYDRFEGELLPYLKTRSREEAPCFDLNMALPLAFYKSAQSLVAWSESGRLLERFKNLKCRKAYFYGEQNSGMKVFQRLGGVERRSIRHSGHFMMNENPEAFYSELRDFLSI